MNYEAALLNVSLLWLLTTPHEFAHAWTALKLGDETPKNEGRVTLNPLAHVDWIGTVLLPALTSLAGMGFLGWGRAVNTNPYRLRGGLNGLAAVALAGPASNVVFAFMLAAAAALTASWLPAVAEYLARGVRLSLYLALFNMIPVPPLDGSKLLLALRFPVLLYNELSRFGFLVLVALMAGTGLLSRMWLWSYAGASRILGWML